MEAARKVTDEISIIPSYFPIPGFGLVPVNAFVLRAQQPVLIDTGLNGRASAYGLALVIMILVPIVVAVRVFKLELFAAKSG